MFMRVGLRLRSAVSDTEIIVVRAPGDDLDIRCGGAPMISTSDDPAGGDIDRAASEPTLLGKRYVDDAGTLEVLCTKGGDGQLSIGTQPMSIKDAKPLPSSD